jgi:biopolymer transport protein ExbB
MNPSLLDLFQRGGPVMWPILLCSIVAVAIVIERLLTFWRIEEGFSNLWPVVTAALRARELPKIETLYERAGGHPLMEMLQAGLSRVGQSREAILSRIEETGPSALSILERHLPVLGTMAHVTPLLGLLGTVTGLVRCFQAVQAKAATLGLVNPSDLAGGIWEALLTTVFGLLVSIPAYVMYHYLLYRLNQFIRLFQTTAAEMADLLSQVPSS